MSVDKIRPARAQELLRSGGLLVCAYDDPEKCRRYRIEGAISLAELKTREPLAAEQELIFYCA